MTGQTSYSFVIKSTYSNYKSNMSSGITINVNGTPGTSNNTDDEDDDEELVISAEGDACIQISPGTTFTAENDTVTINGKKIPSSDITYSYSSGASIPLDAEGEFTITYKINYEGTTYTTRRNVSVKESCS